MDIPETVRTEILDFVDSIVFGGGDSVWLTGSRVRGDARPDSDWDVLVYSPHAPSAPDDLFQYNQTSPHTIDAASGLRARAAPWGAVPGRSCCAFLAT